MLFHLAFILTIHNTCRYCAFGAYRVIMNDIESLTFQDIKNFKSALEKTGTSQQIDFFTIILNTGIRASQILELKFSDVDYKSNSITICKSRKNHELQFLVINDECMQVLIRLKGQYPNDIFVFQSRKSKNQKNKPASSISRQVMTKAFKTASDITSLPVTTSALRHYYARQLLSINFISKSSNLESISRLMGHESTNTTMSYLNKSDINSDENIDELSPPLTSKENIESLLNGNSLRKKSDFSDICQKYSISENDLRITLKTIKILKKSF